jgi:predicted MFS family arabinose efflux permease
MTSDESAEFVREREIVLRLGAASSFLIFFQAYLVAPLIPALSRQFHASDRMVGLLVPAYLLPYGFSTLVYGPLSDRIGRRRVLLALAFAMTVGTIGTALAPTLAALLAWRVFAGIASGGIVPIALALIGDLFPYQQRGRAIGWIFGAIAGGVAFGSTLGAFMNPVIGWRMEFLALAVPIAAVAVLMYRHRALLDGPPLLHRPTLADVIGNYASLWRNPRGRNTYTCICLNAIYHSGVFTWLGFYFSTRFGLGDRGIGLALLGYGVPGMLLGPAIGRWADRVGRRRIIPLGLLLSALTGLALIPRMPVFAAAMVVTTLSFGFDMSHPLLAGIITSVDPERRGQAMGMNAFLIFTGFGAGALLFQSLLPIGLGGALAVFAIGEMIVAAVSVRLFRNEHRHVEAGAVPIPAAIAGDVG